MSQVTNIAEALSQGLLLSTAAGGDLNAVRAEALDKASYWLQELEEGRGYPTTLEYVRDLLEVVKSIDSTRL